MFWNAIYGLLKKFLFFCDKILKISIKEVSYGKVYSLGEAVQKGTAENQQGQARHLGRTQSRHPEAAKQQGV